MLDAVIGTNPIVADWTLSTMTSSRFTPVGVKPVMPNLAASRRLPSSTALRNKIMENSMIPTMVAINNGAVKLNSIAADPSSLRWTLLKNFFI